MESDCGLSGDAPEVEMTTLNTILRYRKRLLWMLLAVMVVSAVWVLKVEVAYQRNSRHLPAQYRLRMHGRPYNWKA